MSVYQRGTSKRWYYHFEINGKSYRKSVPEARTEREALQAEAVAKSEIFRQRYGAVEREAMPFEVYAEKVFLTYSAQNKKSFQSDIYHVKTLIEFFGKTPLHEIKPRHIEQFKTEQRNGVTRKGTRRDAATVNRKLATLSKIFSLAFNDELIDINSCERVTRLKQSGKRERVLSGDEEKRLYHELNGLEHQQQILTLALNTGLRLGAILKLTWFDVDFKQREITARDTKNGTNIKIPMNEFVENLLKESSANKQSEFVITSPKTGGQLTTIKTAFTKALKRADIKDFRFHDLRHTAATRLAEAGTDIFTLCAILGWKDVRIASRYVHAASDTKRKAVEKLTKLHGEQYNNSTKTA